MSKHVNPWRPVLNHHYFLANESKSDIGFVIEERTVGELCPLRISTIRSTSLAVSTNLIAKEVEEMSSGTGESENSAAVELQPKEISSDTKAKDTKNGI